MFFCRVPTYLIIYSKTAFLRYLKKVRVMQRAEIYVILLTDASSESNDWIKKDTSQARLLACVLRPSFIFSMK